jgi:DNA invertase Pin-like site-specific DNA recombinase
LTLASVGPSGLPSRFKLDRLARSLADARDILDELTKRNVKLSPGGSIHDPTDPVGRLLFNVLAIGGGVGD